tara:strand:+ start:722 stop:1045 length:324 start_codon:yes stop_codon:yes gene_type:complete
MNSQTIVNGLTIEQINRLMEILSEDGFDLIPWDGFDLDKSYFRIHTKDIVTHYGRHDRREELPRVGNIYRPIHEGLSSGHVMKANDDIPEMEPYHKQLETICLGNVI